MSDAEEPTQQPTPSKTPKRPSAPERSESEQSVEDQGYESRSRSQSRRRRRQNQRQRAQKQQLAQQQQDGGGANAKSMAKIDEEKGPEAQAEAATAEQPQQKPMMPFERLGDDTTSMDGPVTYARAMRGEIPMRGAPPNEVQGGKKPWIDAKSGGKDIMDEEGLKLRIELNLDLEIELKASIHGDLTLALLA